MQLLNVLSLTPHVNDWLASSRQPRVLHLFDHACNLINEDREILSIVIPTIGNGPFNLVVEDEICFSEYLSLESEVSTSPAQLHLGDLTVHTANAKIWNPCPDWEKLRARKDDIRHQLTQLPTLAPDASAGVTNYMNSGGLDTPFAKTAQGYSTSARVQSLVSILSLALVNADVSSALKLTSQLAGLGPGLTPAGDDYIMGAIYAAWIIHPFEIARMLAKEIADSAAPLTTSLSAAWLRSAGRGEAGILWHKFFDALGSVGWLGNPTHPKGVQEAMENILAVGETSGADALAGFTSVFVSWMKKAGFSHE